MTRQQLRCCLPPLLVVSWGLLACPSGCGSAGRPAGRLHTGPPASSTTLLRTLPGPLPAAPDTLASAHPSPPPDISESAPAPVASDAPPSHAGPPSDVHRRLDDIAADLDAGRTAVALARATTLVASVDQEGTLDERVAAHALQARIHDRAGSAAHADAEYARARDLWNNAPHAVDRVGIPGEPVALRYLRLARALDAAGEAVFYAAERNRSASVDPLRFPPFPQRTGASRPSMPLDQMSAPERDRELARRKAESDAVQRHVNGPVRDWMNRKRRAIEDAEKLYSRVLDLQPVPPPRWVVSSASRIGQMWSDFADDLRKAPLPAWMQADPGIVAAYRRSLDDATSPVTERARASFEICRSMSERYGLRTDLSAACRQWLDAHADR